MSNDNLIVNTLYWSGHAIKRPMKCEKCTINMRVVRGIGGIGHRYILQFARIFENF